MNVAELFKQQTRLAVRLLTWHTHQVINKVSGHPLRQQRPTGWQDWSFSQKVKWRCTHPDPLVRYEIWADKHLVKQIVAPYFDVARSFAYTTDPRSIDTTVLPATYVMKATHGWNMCLLVKDGKILGTNKKLYEPPLDATRDTLIEIAEDWLRSKAQRKRRKKEIQYALLRPGIVFEELIDPVDYEPQFFLFNGRCALTMISYRGFYHKKGIKFRLYDDNWKLLGPGSEKAAKHYNNSPGEIAAPPDHILRDLQVLCRDIDHVRADFYVSDGKYYFGEFTFTHSAGKPGYLGYYDETLGRFWT